MKKGFTLIELMVVVAIISILSAIGVPMYMGYADNSELSVVKNNLRSIYLAEQEFYRKNSQYYSTGGVCSNSTTAINTDLFSSQNIISNNKFYYCILQESGEDFTARAAEITGTRFFTINNLNVTSW